MITDKILDWGKDLIIAILAFLPEWQPPTWLPEALGHWETVVTNISGLSHWVPMNAVVQVTIALALASMFSFALRLARIAISLSTGGGGSAS